MTFSYLIFDSPDGTREVVIIAAPEPEPEAEPENA